MHAERVQSIHSIQRECSAFIASRERVHRDSREHIQRDCMHRESASRERLPAAHPKRERIHREREIACRESVFRESTSIERAHP